MKKIILLVLILLTSCAPTTYRSRYTEVEAPVKAPPPKKAITILIDPGHGGKDEGAQAKNPRYQEKQLTLATALLLKKHLLAMGYRVLMTRGDDTFIPLDARASFANSNDIDLFVSVHYNAAQAKDAHGIEVYYYNSDKNPSRTTASKKLGDAVLVKIINETKAKSRGVKHGNLAVVRETKMPAILIEGGFLTNEAERNRILDQNYDYIKRLARGIAAGVRDYIRQNA